MRRLPAFLTLLLGLSACSYSHSSLSFERADWKHKATRTDTVELDFLSGEALWIDVRYASIDVRTSNVEKPRLEAEITMRGQTEEEAQSHLDQVSVERVHTSRGLELRLSGQPIDYVIEASSRRRVTTKFWATASLRAIVPEKTPLNVRTHTGSTVAVGPFGATDVRTRYGSVTVTNVEGNVRLENHSGKLSLEQANGRSVVLDSQYGAIALDNVEANTFSAETGSGNLVAENVKATTIQLETRYGKIDASGVRGSFTAKTNSGNITLEGQADGNIAIATTYGAVSVKGATAGSIRANTRSGTIRLEDVRGDVVAESRYAKVYVRGALATVRAKSSNAGVEIDAEPGSKPDGEWRIVSTHGPLTLTVPEDFSASVHATTRYGVVDTEIPIVVQGKVGRQSTLTGQIGSGGPTVRLETRNGNIFLKRR